MNYIQILLSGLVVSALFRVLAIFMHRSWFAQGFLGDSSIHFSIIMNLKKNKKARFIEQYLISPEPMSYPLGFHRFAMLFPIALLRKKSYLPNFLIFVGFSTVFFQYLNYVGEHFITFSQGDRFFLLAVGIYLLSVSNLVFQGPAIAYLKLSERLLGRMSSSFFFLFLFGGMYWGDRFALSLSVLFGTLALISSIFARQAIFFTVPMLSLLVFDLTPFFVLVIATVFSVIVSRQQFLDGMKHTILTWTLYATHTKRSSIVKRGLSSFLDITKINNPSTTLLKKIYHLISSEPLRLLIFYPETIIITFFVFFSLSATYNLIAPILATLIVYFITSTERFNHLGESYRYIEYNLYFLFPTIIALLFLKLSALFLVASVSLYFLYVVVIAFLFAIFWARKQKWPKRDLLTEFLDNLALSREDVVFPVSMRLGADICARKECKSFWWQPGIISTGIYDEFIEEYPFLKKDWAELFDKYDVTHVVVDKSMLGMISWKYDFSNLNLIQEDEKYSAYTVNRTHK